MCFFSSLPPSHSVVSTRHRQTWSTWPTKKYRNDCLFCSVLRWNFFRSIDKNESALCVSAVGIIICYMFSLFYFFFFICYLYFFSSLLVVSIFVFTQVVVLSFCLDCFSKIDLNRVCVWVCFAYRLNELTHIIVWRALCMKRASDNSQTKTDTFFFVSYKSYTTYN